ncbi:MAG: 50S ribosomal protein L4 [Patescibacteria group bacterium]
MELPLYNQEAQSVGTVKLADGVFGVPMNQDLLHQVVSSQMANQRQSIAHTKTRSEVRGGGKKPWQQKGTGRARHGSIRSPIWKGGGATFGPRNDKNFKKKINRAMARKALAVALSSKANEKQILMLDGLKIADAKTKEASRVLNGLRQYFTGSKTKAPSTLVVLPAETGSDLNIRAFRNIPRVELRSAKDLNALIALSFQQLLITKDAAAEIEKLFIKKQAA